MIKALGDEGMGFYVHPMEIDTVGKPIEDANGKRFWVLLKKSLIYHMYFPL